MRIRLNSPGLEPMTWNFECLRRYQLDHRGDRYMYCVACFVTIFFCVSLTTIAVHGASIPMISTPDLSTKEGGGGQERERERERESKQSGTRRPI